VSADLCPEYVDEPSPERARLLTPDEILDIKLGYEVEKESRLIEFNSLYSNFD